MLKAQLDRSQKIAVLEGGAPYGTEGELLGTGDLQDVGIGLGEELPMVLQHGAQGCVVLKEKLRDNAGTTFAALS